ncbi:hypothetical protein LEP1GSC051_2300 [Leptospira sp. P2653]|nr:hypothetical protein LEP1GSC051_2300 [Leptospira sp. P2653]
MIQIRKETKSNFKKQTSIFPNLKSVAVHPGAQRSGAEPTPKVASVLRKTGSPLEKVKR